MTTVTRDISGKQILPGDVVRVPGMHAALAVSVEEVTPTQVVVSYVDARHVVMRWRFPANLCRRVGVGTRPGEGVKVRV